MERSAVDLTDFEVEHKSVSGILFVTIDGKLMYLEKFQKHIKLEVVFDKKAIETPFALNSANYETLQIPLHDNYLDIDKVVDNDQNYDDVGQELDKNEIHNPIVGHENDDFNVDIEPITSAGHGDVDSLKSDMTFFNDEMEEGGFDEVKRERKIVDENKTFFDINLKEIKTYSSDIDESRNQSIFSDSSVNANEMYMEESGVQCQKDESLHRKNPIETAVLCSYCKKKFKSRRALVRHHRISTEIGINCNQYSCDICESQFKYKAQCVVHKKLVHGIDTLQNNDGQSKSFSIQTDANDIKTYRCDMCDNVRNSISSLERHMRKHTMESLYGCCVCNFQFSDLESFNTHLQEHIIINNRVKKVSCCHCLIDFEDTFSYEAHHKVKTATYRCGYCATTFNNKAHLVVHTNIVHETKVPISFVTYFGVFLNTKKDILHCDKTTHDNKEVSYRCNICDSLLKDMGALNNHMMKHTNEYLFKCCVCDFEERDEISFSQHLSSHDHNEVQNKNCQYCLKSFQNFNSHYKVKRSKISCKKCTMTFRYKGHLLTHYNIWHRTKAPLLLTYPIGLTSDDNHLSGILCTKESSQKNGRGVKEYKCSICDSKYCALDSLNKHMLRHTGEHIFECCVCEYKAFQAAPFKAHLAKHGRLKQIECKECNVYVKDRATLAEHQATHEIRCELCEEEFHSKVAKSDHLLIRHKTDERILRCDLCPRLYTSKRSFQEHQKFHRFLKHFQCPVCGLVMSTKNQKVHMERHSAIEFACDKCPKKFKDSNTLRGHKKTHTIFNRAQCPKCYKMITRSSLANHIRVMHLQPGEKPYVCEICGKACSERGNLRTHMKIHFKQ